MSSVSSMKATKSDQMVDASAAKQKFAADRFTGTMTSSTSMVRPANETPFFANGTVRAGTCSKSNGGCHRYTPLSQVSAPGTGCRPSSVKAHVKYANY